MELVHGQLSHRLSSAEVDLAVTQLGGMVGPAEFKFAGRTIAPFHVAPFAEEGSADLPILQALRGDFFCMPFGANLAQYSGEQHPLHGEPANEKWELLSQGRESLEMSLDLHVRPGRVVKTVSLQPGHHAIYQSHEISGMAGPMTLGHHAMLHFSEPGLVSVSPFHYGQVYPFDFEVPSQGGYTSLKPGAHFDSLASVPMANGQTADLSRYPAREGFEDLAIVYSDPNAPFGWSAVTFLDSRYVWISLKDPRVLSATVLWHSNGGRHYAPWNGRHRNVLGIEEVTGFFAMGLSESLQENEASRAGMKTHLMLNPSEPTHVNTIMAVAEVPAGFSHVASIVGGHEGVTVRDDLGNEVFIPLDQAFSTGAGGTLESR